LSGANRLAPRSIPTTLAVQHGPHPETRFRWPAPPPTRAKRPSPVERSFFICHLSLEILLRMHRSRLQTDHAQFAQPAAHGLFAYPHRPSFEDLLAQVDPAPTHHPVPFRIGPFD